MPEFLLRYDGPDSHEQALKIAAAVEQTASDLFGMEVVWDTRPFGLSKGMPDFYVTGWITDNDDTKIEKVLEVQAAVLEAMQQHTRNNQRVECWWCRVKGKWSGATGLLT